MDKLPLRITFRHMGPSEAVETAIRRHAARLPRFAGRIVGCRVVVEAPHQHHRKGKLYSVRIDLVAPREAIAVSRQGPSDHAHEDVYVAIRDAFETATRLLEDHSRRLRGEVKAHARRVEREEWL